MCDASLRVNKNEIILTDGRRYCSGFKVNMRNQRKHRRLNRSSFSTDFQSKFSYARGTRGNIRIPFIVITSSYCPLRRRLSTWHKIATLYNADKTVLLHLLFLLLLHSIVIIVILLLLLLLIDTVIIVWFQLTIDISALSFWR